MKHLLIILSFLLLSSPVIGAWNLHEHFDEMENIRLVGITSSSINKHGRGFFAKIGSFHISWNSSEINSNKIGLMINFNKFLGHENYDNDFRKVMLKVDNEKTIHISGRNSKDQKIVYLNMFGENDGIILKLLKQMKKGKKIMVRTLDFEFKQINYVFSLKGFTDNLRKFLNEIKKYR